jgi:lysophospholipase L1-like esterase
MPSDKPTRRGSSFVHPVGDKGPATYWRRRALAVAVAAVIAGLVGVGAVIVMRSEAPGSPTAAGSASASPSTAEPASTTPTPSPSSTTDDRKKKKNKDKAEPSWTPVPGAVSQNGAWGDYPWGSDGLECPPPATSPAAGSSPRDPGVVVILGDSLIRDSRDAIASSLASYGMSAQFVCWGGKNLDWGLAQVETMRSLSLLPTCLVINLGTNDLKGTTANGLADAVPLTTVGERLQSILLGSADITHVFAVDIAADLSLAPSTMADVDGARQVWQNAVSDTGVGEVIPWAASTRNDPGLIGSDGIHDSGSGQQVRARIIADAVAPYCTP